MRLKDTVAYFAKQEVTDSYSGSVAFNGLFDVYSGSVRDSLTGGRRTITVAPSAVVPTRKCITFDSDVFIVGDEIKGAYKESTIKKHLVLHPADSLGEVGTSANMLNSSGSTSMYMARSWRKSQKEESESSEMFNLFNFYVGKGESGSRNNLILLGGRYYRIQGSEDTTGGFVILVASELEADTVQTISYTPASGTYDPVSDSHAVSASFNILAFVERYQTSFRYTSASAVKYKPGDVMVTFTSDAVANPLVGDLIQISGVGYSILALSSDLAGSWETHLRSN